MTDNITTIRETVNQQILFHSQNAACVQTKTMYEKIVHKIRNIDLTSLKNNSLVTRAYNLGWKTPAIIIFGLICTHELVKHLRKIQKECSDIKFTENTYN